MLRIVDSHCHLDFPQFEPDLDEVVGRAHDSGVVAMVTICTKPSRVGASRELAERFNQVYFAAGVHPHYVASEEKVSIESLLELAKHPKMVAIGETGLDYHYTKETAEAQQRSLRVHIEASRRSGLPLIIHSRDADEDMRAILTEEHGKEPFSCVMHCFSSGKELAEATLELGFYLSISGIVTFNSARQLQDIFREVPTDRILLETDAPYLAPAPWRGKRNEPAMVERMARKGAELHDMEVGEFANMTTENFQRLFAKARIPEPSS